MQMGDATNFVMIFAGELLKLAEDLLRLGLHPSEIASGYEKAMNFALKALDGKYSLITPGLRRLTKPELVVDKIKDIRSVDELTKAVRTVIGSKQFGNEDILAPLVAEAILMVLPKNPTQFNVDNIRVVKIM